MRHLNPGPGFADFWSEFKRPTPYRWPILGVSVLITSSLLYLLSGNAQKPNLLVVLILAAFASVAVAMFVMARVRLRIGILLIAAGISAITIWQFAKLRAVGPNPKPEVIWITTFAPNRTDGEIMASNIAAQKEQDKIEAAEAAAAQRRKELYAELGRATGIDVDAMEKQIAAEKAQEKAASDRARQQAQLRKQADQPAEQPAPDATQ